MESNPFSSTLPSLVHQFFNLGQHQARVELETQLHALKSHPNGLSLALNLLFQYSHTNSNLMVSLPSDFPLPFTDLRNYLTSNPISIDPSLQPYPHFFFVILGVLHDLTWKYSYFTRSLQLQFFASVFTLVFCSSSSASFNQLMTTTSPSPQLQLPSFVNQKAISLLANVYLCEWCIYSNSPWPWICQFPLQCAFFPSLIDLATQLGQTVASTNVSFLVSKQTQCLSSTLWPASTAFIEAWVLQWMSTLYSTSASLTSTKNTIKDPNQNSPYLSPISPSSKPFSFNATSSFDATTLTSLFSSGFSLLQSLPSPPSSSNLITCIQQLCQPSSLSIHSKAFELMHAWLSKPNVPMPSFQLLFQSVCEMLSQPSLYFASTSFENQNQLLQAWFHLVHPLLNHHLTRFTPSMFTHFLSLLLPYYQDSTILTIDMMKELDTLIQFFLTLSIEETYSSSRLVEFTPSAMTLASFLLSFYQQACSSFSSFSSLQTKSLKKQKQMVTIVTSLLLKLSEAFPNGMVPLLTPILEPCYTQLSNALQSTTFTTTSLAPIMDTAMRGFTLCLQCMSSIVASHPSLLNQAITPTWVSTFTFLQDVFLHSNVITFSSVQDTFKAFFQFLLHRPTPLTMTSSPSSSSTSSSSLTAPTPLSKDSSSSSSVSWLSMYFPRLPLLIQHSLRSLETQDVAIQVAHFLIQCISDPLFQISTTSPGAPSPALSPSISGPFNHGHPNPVTSNSSPSRTFTHVNPDVIHWFPTSSHSPSSPLFPYYVYVLAMTSSLQEVASFFLSSFIQPLSTPTTTPSMSSLLSSFFKTLTLLYESTSLSTSFFIPFMETTSLLNFLTSASFLHLLSKDQVPLLVHFLLSSLQRCLKHAPLKYTVLTMAQYLEQYHLNFFYELIQGLLQNRCLTLEELPPFTNLVIQKLHTQRTENLPFSPESIQLVNLVLLQYAPLFLSSSHSKVHSSNASAHLPTFMKLIETLFQCLQSNDIELVRIAIKGLKDLQSQFKLFEKELWHHHLSTAATPVLLGLILQPSLHLLMDDIMDLYQSLLLASSSSSSSSYGITTTDSTKTTVLNQWKQWWLSQLCSTVAYRYPTSTQQQQEQHKGMVEWIQSVVSEDIDQLQDSTSFGIHLTSFAKDIKCILASI